MALRRMGVERAWMLGDTVDDLEAARLAGVVPIGVVAPGDDPSVTTRTLATAAVVLDQTNDLEELLR
jgi:phosphoglycolate phosphatase-like HAD superfamily hydrolase